VISVLLALGTGGCTQDQPDSEVTAPTFADTSPQLSEAAPSAPAPTEPSPAPTEAAPPLPDLAVQQTPEGAVAFTQWWFETLNYATATGDTAGLRAASDPACGTCDSFVLEIENAFTSGGRIEGGLFDVRVDPAGALEPLGVRVPVFADVSATEIMRADGSAIKTFDAEQSTIVFTALLTDAGWVAGGLA